jgi:hypothetical protein
MGKIHNYGLGCFYMITDFRESSVNLFRGPKATILRIKLILDENRYKEEAFDIHILRDHYTLQKLYKNCSKP